MSRAPLVKLKYEEMKKQLLKIFSECISSSSRNVTVKEEVLEASNKKKVYYSYKGRSGRGGQPRVCGCGNARGFRGVNENNGRCLTQGVNLEIHPIVIFVRVYFTEPNTA